MSLSDKDGAKTTAAAISSIGLSPLLVGISGVFYEAPKISKRSFAITSPLATVDTIKIRIYGALRNEGRKVHC
jgi:hypothetical protein